MQCRCSAQFDGDSSRQSSAEAAADTTGEKAWNLGGCLHTGILACLTTSRLFCRILTNWHLAVNLGS